MPRLLVIDAALMKGFALELLGEALRYKPERIGFDSQWVHWDFSLTLSFRPHCEPGVDSASNIHG
jgi:hypothetical protein